MNDSVIAVFDDHNAAGAAVKRLSASGFDMKSLSVVGTGYHIEERSRASTMSATASRCGGSGTPRGRLSGPVLRRPVPEVPIVGQVIFLGYIAAAFSTEGAVVVGGFSALGAALSSLGIPKDSVLRYETTIKADQFLVMAHGTALETTRAKDILAPVTHVGSSITRRRPMPNTARRSRRIEAQNMTAPGE